MTDIVSLIELASSDMDLRTRVDALQEIANQATMETPEAIEFLNRVAKYELGAELAAYGQTSLYHLKEKYPGLKSLEGPLDAENSAYERLGDDSFEQRLRAIEYFEREGVTSSVPELIKQLKHEHHPHVVSKLTKTLGLLGADFDNEEIFNVLVPFLKHKDERIRANTIQGMGGLQSNRKIPLLLDALMLDQDERVQNMASVVLSLENVEPTLLLLKEKLESGDSAVFDRAMAALREIERPEAWALYESYKESAQKIKTEQAFREAIDLEWDEEADEVPDFSAEMDDAEIFDEIPEIKLDSSEEETSTQELIPVESLVEEPEPMQAFPSPPVSSPPPPVSSPPPPVSSPPPPESSPPNTESASGSQEQVQYAYNPAMSETYQHPPEEEQSLPQEEDPVPEFKIFDKPKPPVAKPSKPKKKSRNRTRKDEELYYGFFGFIGYFFRKLIFATVLGGLAILYLRYEKEIVKFSYVEIESYKAGRGILFAKLPPPRKKVWVSRKDNQKEPETTQQGTGQIQVRSEGQEQRPDMSQQPPEKVQSTDGQVVPDTPRLQRDSFATRPAQPPSIKLTRRKGKKDLSSLDGFTRHTYSNGDRYIGTFRSGKRNGEGSLFYMNGEVYVGQWKNNQFHGEGTYTWPGGDRFVGSFMDGKRSGKGVFSWVNGESFEGEYAQGLRSGRGKMSFSNGEIYDGEWAEDLFNGAGVYTFSDGSIYEGNYEEGQPHGEGRYVYSNGRIYEGEFEVGKRHGEGRMVFPNGELYEGFWNEEEYHGSGAYRWASGDWYRGDWQKGKMHGTGLYHWANGDEYEGEYKNDRPNGVGELIYQNEGRYKGAFKDGLREGEGTYYAPAGYSYSGSWKLGKRHGLGITKWSDGEGYRGQWKQGLEHGMGRYSWAGGEKYIGQWRDGFKNGLGTFISSDGQIREGLWKDDQFVGSVPGDILEWKKELQFMNFFFERTKENTVQPAG